MKLWFLALTLLVLWQPISWAGVLDKDRVAETQTRVVPATEETIKNSGKGAPAPSFKIVQDTGEFFIQKPYEYDRILQKKKLDWSLFSEDEEVGENGETEYYSEEPQETEPEDETSSPYW